MWAELLRTRDPRSVALVGCDSRQEIVGFAAGGAERTGELGCEGELYAIYILPGAQRKGLGTLLVSRFACELRLRGLQSMAVWVLAANSYRKFYEALGGHFITEKTIERGGQSLIEVAYYGWSDLAKFRG